VKRIVWMVLAGACVLPCVAQRVLTEQIAARRMVVVFRQGLPADAAARVQRAGGRVTATMERFGMAAVEGDDAAAAQMRLDPGVAAVLRDRIVQGHVALMTKTLVPLLTGDMPETITPVPVMVKPVGRTKVRAYFVPIAASDAQYASGKGWAVQAAGGYGDNVPNGELSPATGPWNVSLGAGVRIAVLDSGVDANHPDIAPNLAVNMTEVNEAQMASPCDTGTPQDQQGHGTWVASLAAGALGGGDVAGVAPQATLLNIKVMQRMPGTGATTVAACENGEPSGLLSWVLQGINDAVTQHADVAVLSLGTLVDLTTGDGAGWKAQFDAVTYAAAEAGTVIVAATGNDGLDLSQGTLAELPAMSRGVLAVTASTNAACAENLAQGATCKAGAVTMPYYANHGVSGEIAAPGGSYPEMTTGYVSGFVTGACSSGLTNTVDGMPANGASFGCFGYGHQQYVQAMGTSASAALVAGAAAIVRAAHPGWSAAKIVTTLQQSATASSVMRVPELNLQAAILAD